MFAGIVSREDAVKFLTGFSLTTAQIEYALDVADDLRPGFETPNLRIYGDDAQCDSYMIRWNGKKVKVVIPD